jgi:hypothetical protein
MPIGDSKPVSHAAIEDDLPKGPQISDSLRCAVSAVSNVSLLEYDVNFYLKPANEIATYELREELIDNGVFPPI